MPEIKEIRKFANFIEQKIKNEYIKLMVLLKNI